MAAPGPRVALIAGGCSGIGAALVERLVQRGTVVVIADSSLASGGQPGSGARDGVRLVPMDISRRDQIDELFGLIRREFGHLDLVVNCAGISSHGESSDIPPEEWDRILDVNLRGSIDLSLGAFALMRDTGGGTIVNLASMAAYLYPPLFGPYITSKAGVIAFSRALAIESEAQGVRVSVACPGNVRTPMLKSWKQSFLTPSISPLEAADAILRGVAKRRRIMVFPLHARLYWYLDRLHPSLLVPLRREILRRARARKGS